MHAVRRCVRSALAWTACLMLLAPVASAACADEDVLVPTGTDRGTGLPAHLLATHCLINQERTARGLRPLTLDAKLVGAAYSQAADMLARRFFTHTGSDGSSVADRVLRSRYPGDPERWLVGENLGWGTAGLAAPRAIVDAWLTSPDHREVLLDPVYDEIGLMVLAGAPTSDAATGATYVAELGTRTAPTEPTAAEARTTARRKRAARCRARAAAARRTGATRQTRRAARRCR